MSTTILHTTEGGAALGPATSPRGGASAAEGVLAALRSTLGEWRRRAQGRRDLRVYLSFQRTTGGLTPWADLGVSREELLTEARKPFWRA
jgi:uncharacterized protein YjiS (DUF1127 family)